MKQSCSTLYVQVRSRLRYSCLDCEISSICHTCAKLCHINHRLVDRNKVVLEEDIKYESRETFQKIVHRTNYIFCNSSSAISKHRNNDRVHACSCGLYNSRCRILFVVSEAYNENNSGDIGNGYVYL